MTSSWLCLSQLLVNSQCIQDNLKIDIHLVIHKFIASEKVTFYHWHFLYKLQGVSIIQEFTHIRKYWIITHAVYLHRVYENFTYLHTRDETISLLFTTVVKYKKIIVHYNVIVIYIATHSCLKLLIIIQQTIGLWIIYSILYGYTNLLITIFPYDMSLCQSSITYCNMLQYTQTQYVIRFAKTRNNPTNQYFQYKALQNLV